MARFKGLMSAQADMKRTANYIVEKVVGDIVKRGRHVSRASTGNARKWESGKCGATSLGVSYISAWTCHGTFFTMC